MGIRIAAAIGAGLFVLAWLPGAAADDNADQPVEVSGTTEPPIVGEHKFVPDRITVRSGGTVIFTNDEFSVAGFGAPHSWTVLARNCIPAGPVDCEFDTGVLPPGAPAVSVSLDGLEPGEYTFICKVGQGQGGPPIPLFPPHAKSEKGTWTGMVGVLTVQ